MQRCSEDVMTEVRPGADALSWSALDALAPPAAERIEGPANAQATLRLFGQPEASVRVTLFRDHHAWCPYCQKVWLWLEFRRIPYRIRKVTMRCYGPKEPWFTALVPSGMLPALDLDGRLITESDRILESLERSFGPVGAPMADRRVRRLRDLERLLFRAWCIWLCTPGLGERQEVQARDQFQRVARQMEQALASGGGSWLDPDAPDGPHPGTADLVFIPYVERMNASLAYFKGFALRREHPGIDRWLAALERLATYRGTQSDVHTHAHDLPPQMGGCWSDGSDAQLRMARAVDSGAGLDELESRWSCSGSTVSARERALERVLRHRCTLVNRNPLGDRFDQPLRAALTAMVLEQPVTPERGSASALRYLRDRISVPRDMPLESARVLRKVLESTAALDGDQQSDALPFEHRFDQDPRPFLGPQQQPA
ncbi:glutathione S-transferase [Synechococcus sp. MIT S9509]|uniref:glutathione S-transferase n=2 Tax=Synechococcus TaxID=1129 RepID=UPI0039AEE177|tara:strand:- start:881 stop:2164 length:1284 start_codon:yes stop_codon:yes gene_type:complete